MCATERSIRRTRAIPDTLYTVATTATPDTRACHPDWLDADWWEREIAAIVHDENPVRANLVQEPNQWPFTVAILPGYPTLDPHTLDYWPTFWRIHSKLRHPNANQIRRPPI